MLSKELCKDSAVEDRKQILKDNCDKVEEVTYSRSLTPEEMAKQREQLTNASIKLAELEEQKQDADDDFKYRMKPYKREVDAAIKTLRDKSVSVTEECYKFLDEETKMIGYYNANGDLINSRPAFLEELQKTIFADMRKTGTTEQH